MKNLRNILILNAVSSGMTGIALVVFAGAITDLMGPISPMAVTETGVFLVIFAAFVMIEGLRASLKLNRITAIIVVDILWVMASIFIVILQLFNLTVLGYALIAGVAVWVAAMAYFQSHGKKSIQNGMPDSIKG